MRWRSPLGIGLLGGGVGCRLLPASLFEEVEDARTKQDQTGLVDDLGLSTCLDSRVIEVSGSAVELQQDLHQHPFDPHANLIGFL